MKFKITQGDLAGALLAVNKSLLSKVNLPILANVLMSVTDSDLEILSTNLETATRVKVGCRVEGEGQTTVPGRMLWEFVSQLPEQEIVFEKLGEELVVITRGYNARFATMAVEDFPAIPKIEKGYELAIESGELLRAINRVVYSAAADEGRPVLTGVLCEVGSNFMSLVATDGYRLSFQKTALVKKKNAALKIIIPAKAMMELAKLIGEQAEGQKNNQVVVLVGENLNQVNFKLGEVEYTSRLIEGEFPSWQKIIPTNFTTRAKISREELTRLVRIASIFARDAGNIVRLKLEPTGGGAVLRVAATNNQLGSNEAETKVELTGQGGEIAFNFRYLLEMLGSVDGEDVYFEMIESLNPGRLTLAGEATDYFHIIMPVRLQS